MKTLRLFMAFAAFTFLAAASPTATPTPVNLTTIFGSPSATPVPASPCAVSATKNPITANGVDSAVISIVDAAKNPITLVPTLSVSTANGVKTFNNVTYPQTVIASSPGEYDLYIPAGAGVGTGCTFSFFAQ